MATEDSRQEQWASVMEAKAPRGPQSQGVSKHCHKSLENLCHWTWTTNPIQQKTTSEAKKRLVIQTNSLFFMLNQKNSVNIPIRYFSKTRFHTILPSAFGFQSGLFLLDFLTYTSNFFLNFFCHVKHKQFIISLTETPLLFCPRYGCNLTKSAQQLLDYRTVNCRPHTACIV